MFLFSTGFCENIKRTCTNIGGTEICVKDTKSENQKAWKKLGATSGWQTLSLRK